MISLKDLAGAKRALAKYQAEAVAQGRSLYPPGYEKVLAGRLPETEAESGMERLMRERHQKAVEQGEALLRIMDLETVTLPKAAQRLGLNIPKAYRCRDAAVLARLDAEQQRRLKA